MKKIQLKNGLQLSKERLSRLQETQMTDLKGGKNTPIYKSSLIENNARVSCY